MQSYDSLVAHALKSVAEIFPWDLEDLLSTDKPPLLIDVREPTQYAMAHIRNSLHVPRGQLEGACEWNFRETEPELVTARDRPVVLVCCSGRRSALAVETMAILGYTQVQSLKTGIKGWNDADLPLIDGLGNLVDADQLDEYLNRPLPTQNLARGRDHA